ncbi:MAG: hypothetical protein M0P69_19565 [Bacteroidales bacterium]|jgi:hypothetical protein|nr:hypothetical protein [Bacteroidales bacterium]
MINYSEIQIGNILQITGEGAPGYAANGDLVKVIEKKYDSVRVENKHGETAVFKYSCGAARLEQTGLNDFPAIKERGV